MIRNCNGSILYAEANTFLAVDALQAEVIAIKNACLFLTKAKLENIIFEADCINAILYTTDQSSIPSWSSRAIVEEIRRFWFMWPKWKFKACSRNVNFCAHHLAKWAFSCSWNGFIPLNLIQSTCFCDESFPIVNSFPIYKKNK